MHCLLLSFLALCIGVANAHFHLNFPEPRGVFVADNEPKFCGGYTEVTTNRSMFPLSGGFFTIKQGHPSWAVAVLISTDENPNSFDKFNGSNGEQYARFWAKADTPGEFCIPLDLSNTNITDVRDGANATIQISVTGGDGTLYQCADLTLASNFTLPQEIVDSCKNTTASSSASASGPAPTSGASGRVQRIFGNTALFFAFIGSAPAIL